MNAVPHASEFGEDLENALRSVDAVLAHKDNHESVGEISGRFSVAVRSVVHLRNGITAANRAGTALPGTPSLDHVNALISLMAGIEYPLAGIHWSRIQRVRDDLTQMLAAQQVVRPT